MQKTTLILATAILFAIGSVAVSSCGSSGQSDEAESHEQSEEHEHDGAEADDDHENSEAGHSHDGGEHMDHMKEVREGLKKEMGSNYDTPVPEATEAQLTLGQETYTKTCVTCHGETGKGDGPASVAFEQKPADFTDPGHSKYYSDQARIYIIKNGVKDTPMVGWESVLSEEEIGAVYAYVRSLRSSDEGDEVDHGDGMYTCSMHPEVSGNKDGKCPICGMTLIPKEHEDDDDDEGHDHEH
jgi:mono/diheme cytochrome c family protein